MMFDGLDFEGGSILDILSNGRDEKVSFEPVSTLEECVGWDGYIDPQGNFYKTKPRGAKWYRGSANLHYEYAVEYLEHIGVDVSNINDAKDHLVEELGWVSYGYLTLLQNEVYIQTPYKREGVKVTDAQKKKLLELFILNNDDLRVYKQAIRNEDLVLDEDENKTVNTILETDLELLETVNRIQQREEEARKAAQAEAERKAKERVEYEAKRAVQEAERQARWAEEEKKRREEVAIKAKEALEQRLKEEAIRDEKIVKIFKKALNEPVTIHEKSLVENMLDFCNGYDADDEKFPRYWDGGFEEYLAGDENGEPFTIRLQGPSWIPVSIVIFAKDVDDAKNRFVTALKIAWEKCLRLKRLYYENDGNRNYESFSIHEDRLAGIIKLIPNIKIQPLDKRYIVKAPWAGNDTFL